MMTSKICFSSSHKFARKFLQHLNSLNKFKNRKRPKRCFSYTNWSTSSFAAMEVSNQLKQVFKFIDMNDDGKISPLELSEILLSLGREKSVAAKEAEGILREMDCNGDGFIDMDEFMKVMSTDSEFGCGGVKEEDEVVLMDAFLIFDLDKNGFISAKELQRVLVSLGSEKCSLRECQRMIKGVDRDGDGLVDFEEFRSQLWFLCNSSLLPLGPTSKEGLGWSLSLSGQ